jgi:hypothetical protein
MFAECRDQNTFVQTSAACQGVPRRAQGDTIEFRGYVSGFALHSCSKVECMLRMALCSRALIKHIEGGHEQACWNLQMSVHMRDVAENATTVNSVLACAMAGCHAYADNGQHRRELKRQD